MSTSRRLVYQLHTTDIEILHRELIHEFEHYQQPSPTFFFGHVPQPEEGLVIRKSIDHYLPLSGNSQYILDLAYHCFEHAGIPVNRYGPASIEFLLFHYNDATLTGAKRYPSTHGVDAASHHCIFLVHQDMLVSPTYLDIEPAGQSRWWSRLVQWNSSDESIQMGVGHVVTIRHDEPFTLHGCNGFGNRHIIIVSMTGSSSCGRLGEAVEAVDQMV